MESWRRERHDFALFDEMGWGPSITKQSLPQQLEFQRRSLSIPSIHSFLGEKEKFEIFFSSSSDEWKMKASKIHRARIRSESPDLAEGSGQVKRRCRAASFGHPIPEIFSGPKCKTQMQGRVRDDQFGSEGMEAWIKNVRGRKCRIGVVGIPVDVYIQTEP